MPPRRAEPEALQAYLKWAEGWRAAARRDRFAWAHDIYGMCREDYEDDVDPDAEGAEAVELWIEVVGVVLGSRAMDGLSGPDEVAWVRRFLERQPYDWGMRSLIDAPLQVRLVGPIGQVYLGVDDLADIDLADLAYLFDFDIFEITPTNSCLDRSEAERIFKLAEYDLSFDDPDVRLRWEWEEDDVVVTVHLLPDLTTTQETA